MAWDVTAPRGSDPIGISRKFIAANFTALQTVLSGTHIFPGISATHGMHTPGQTPICEADTEAVISGYTDIAGSISWATNLATFYTNNGSSWDGRGPFSGTVQMLFFQATAPIGWTILTTVNDSIVYSTNTAASGGSARNGGTWTISGIEWSNYHTYSQVPKHRHTIPGNYLGLADYTSDYAFQENNQTRSWATQNAGSAPPLSTSSSSGAVSSDGSWRPKRAISIIATKD